MRVNDQSHGLQKHSTFRPFRVKEPIHLTTIFPPKSDTPTVALYQLQYNILQKAAQKGPPSIQSEVCGSPVAADAPLWRTGADPTRTCYAHTLTMNSPAHQETFHVYLQIAKDVLNGVGEEEIQALPVVRRRAAIRVPL